MDRLDALAGQLSQITFYDIKNYYNQAKNVVLNISEMEAKVREATNDEPWGASSTLMQDIATGTFNFQNFNEIMPCIYSRFMEKEARQWREIYKALQLLEYLIKHGSERVVDDTRSHIGTIKMLRNFHYIDDKGKDEGINVRNRSKELVELLSDVDKIRSERRKAKANRHKYTGTGNDGMSFSADGSRYGGFGNEGGFSGGSYNGGGASGSYDRDYSGSSGGFRDTQRSGAFEEYDAGGDEDPSSTARRSTSISQKIGSSSRRTAPDTAPTPKEPEIDLLGGFDDIPSSATSNSFATDKELPALTTPAAPVVPADEDDFADFQAAPTSYPVASTQPNLMEMLNSAPTQASRSAVSSPPATAGNNPNLFGMLNATPAQPTFTNQYQTSLFGSSSKPMSSPIRATSMTPTSPPIRASSTPAAPAAAKPSSNFDDLWSMSLGPSVTTKPATGGKTMNDLTKEKAEAGIWGGAQKPTLAPMGSAMGGGSGFGNFGGSFTRAHPGGGDDDLLL